MDYKFKIKNNSFIENIKFNEICNELEEICHKSNNYIDLESDSISTIMPSPTEHLSNSNSNSNSNKAILNFTPDIIHSISNINDSKSNTISTIISSPPRSFHPAPPPTVRKSTAQGRFRQTGV